MLIHDRDGVLAVFKMGGVAWLGRGKVECGSESVVGGMDGDGTDGSSGCRLQPSRYSPRAA